MTPVLPRTVKITKAALEALLHTRFDPEGLSVDVRHVSGDTYDAPSIRLRLYYANGLHVATLRPPKAFLFFEV